MWTVGASVSPSLLVDASTMQFSALSFPANPVELDQDVSVTTEMGIAGPDELSDEVSKFLRSSGADSDGCFTFDLEAISEGCSDDI